MLKLLRYAHIITAFVIDVHLFGARATLIKSTNHNHKFEPFG